MTASLASTSEHPALLQSNLPAIDSKTFTDWGPLLLLSRTRTVPLPPDSVKRWAHFHRDGSLGAWSCFSNIIAQMFDKVNLTPVPKWVWEINLKNFFDILLSSYVGYPSTYKGVIWNRKFYHFAKIFRYFQITAQSSPSIYKNAFKIAFCSTFAKIIKNIFPSTYKDAF